MGNADIGRRRGGIIPLSVSEQRITGAEEPAASGEISNIIGLVGT